METEWFLAGVGILVTLDLANLGITVQNAREAGTDEKARGLAEEAQEHVARLHAEFTKHLREKHGEDVKTAFEQFEEDYE